MGAIAERGLTDKQELFCRHYVENGMNAMDAARKAGYESSDSRCDNMRNPAIRSRIKELLAGSIPEPEQVIFALTEQALGLPECCFKRDANGQPDIDWGEVERLGLLHLIDSITLARSGAKVFKLKNSQVALELLAKYHGLLVYRSESTVTERQTVRIEYVNDNRPAPTMALASTQRALDAPADAIDAEYSDSSADYSSSDYDDED